MSSLLIIGASGLLGQALTSSFKKKYSSIGALSRNPINYNCNNIKQHKVDVLNPQTLDSVVKKYDVIINCIGQITFPSSSCLSLNTIGITNIVNSVKKNNKKLIHISTVSVYGNSNYVDEDSELCPVTIYGSMKCFAEYIIRSNLKNYSILRVSNLYGRGQKKGIVNYLQESYFSDEKKLYFNNDGSMKRYYLHIDELARTINQFISKGVIGTYNVIGKDQLTIQELVTMFESILNYKFDINYLDAEPLENLGTINCDKVKKVININIQKDLTHYIENLKL
jgi:nucleoside-diphosphate-sugar epimerase